MTRLPRPVEEPRRKGWPNRLTIPLLGLLPWLPAADALAAAGPARKLVNVADTRTLTPGLSKWIADLYNTSLWQFSLVVVVMMAGLGLLLGFVCDRLIGLLGINLGRIERRE